MSDGLWADLSVYQCGTDGCNFGVVASRAVPCPNCTTARPAGTDDDGNPQAVVTDDATMIKIRPYNHAPRREVLAVLQGVQKTRRENSPTDCKDIYSGLKYAETQLKRVHRGKETTKHEEPA